MNVIEKSITEVRPYENNPRKNDDSIEKVAESIREFGFKVPIIIDKDGIIVTGHSRYEAAKLMGLGSIPCIVADDLTEAQIKAFRIADNKVAEYSDWDYFKLAGELQDVSLELMEGFGFDASELENILTLNSVDEIYAEDVARENETPQTPADQTGPYKPNVEPKQAHSEVTKEEYKVEEKKAAQVMNMATNQRKVLCPHCGDEFYIMM